MTSGPQGPTEEPLDLCALEARFQHDLRPVRANDPLALRPFGYGEVETLLADGRALLAHCRALRAALTELLDRPPALDVDSDPGDWYDRRERAAAVLALARDEHAPGEAQP